MTDADGDGWGDEDPSGAAVAGGDCDDGDAGAYPGADEVEDQADNDCDGYRDEGEDTDCFLDLDGLDDYAYAANSAGWFSIDETTLLTIEVSLSAPPVGVYTPILTKDYGSEGGDWGLRVYHDGSDWAEFYVGGATPRSTNAVADGTWHHIAVVVDRGYISVFRDGGMELERYSMGGSTGESSQLIYIGRPYVAGHGFLEGGVDAIRISSIARYTDASYAVPAVLDVDEDTEALWPMNECGGTTAYDWSGNGLDLTLVGGASLESR